MLNENHNQNGVLAHGSVGVGVGKYPMFAVCSARGAEGDGQDGDVQSLKSKVQSRVAREAEFEDLRLKTKIQPEGEALVSCCVVLGWWRCRGKAPGDWRTPRPGGGAELGLQIQVSNIVHLFGAVMCRPRLDSVAWDRRGKAPPPRQRPRHLISGSLSGAQSKTLWSILKWGARLCPRR
jgi:hypothetical protein